MHTKAQSHHPIDTQLREVFAHFPKVDLIDLSVVGEPLLGQIVRHGRRVLGSDTIYGELISKHLFEQADFMPYQARILAERRMAWIG